MPPKVIWIINQYAGSPVHGMEFRHFFLADEFTKKGVRVYIISGSYSHLYTKAPKTEGDFTFEDIGKITYCWVKIPAYRRSVSLGRISNMIRFMLMLKKMPVGRFEKPNAILVSSPSLFPITQAKKWSKQFNASLIFEVRDVWPLTLQELGNIPGWNPLILWMRWLEKYAYKNADRVVSVLPGAKKHMMDAGMEEKKFACIPNGIEVREMQSEQPLSEGIGRNLPKNKFLVGYLGSIGLSNALDFLIKAAILLKGNENIHFVIVGNGAEKEQLIQLSAGCKNISFIDAIKKEEVQAMLKPFDACYIGWKKESLYRFGISANKLFEYMYSGKPIIHSVQAYNDPVKQAGAGLSVEPENEGLVAEAILKLFNMREEDRIQLGQNGKKYVTEHHLYPSLAANYLSLLFPPDHA